MNEKRKAPQEKKTEKSARAWTRWAMAAAAWLLALEAWGGKVGALGKLAGKFAEHGADNVAVRVAEEGADNAAEAAAKAAAKGASLGARHGRALGAALDRSLEAAKGGINAKTVLAAGGAVAAVDAAHNISKGMRNRSEELGRAEGEAIRDNPELVTECRAVDHRWRNILATGGAVALVAVALPCALPRRRGKESREVEGGKNPGKAGKGGVRGLVQGGKEKAHEETTDE